jgi:signal transduction histidine kinase
VFTGPIPAVSLLAKLLLCVGFSILSVFIGVQVLTKFYSSPIQSLESKAAKILEGDFNVSLEDVRGDELGTLIDVFNKMLSDIKHYREVNREAKSKIIELANLPKENPYPVARFSSEGELIFYNDPARKIAQFFDIDLGEKLDPILFKQLSGGFKKDKNHKFFDYQMGSFTYQVAVAKNMQTGSINMYGQNITHQKEAEAALIEARDKAIELSQVKSKFLATMSHEIRTPMNGIIGLSNILMDMNLNEEQSEITRSIITSANSLLAIINDILDFSKIEAGKMTIEHTPMSLEESVKDCVELFKIPAQNKGIEISYELLEPLPKTIESDSSRLRQIIINLAGNAVKFTEQGEVKVVCSSESIGDGLHRIQFEIKDSGIGIPEDLQHRLFQDFSQVDGSITRKFGGTGLGLSICKKLVELLGGKIWVESQQGIGSSFFFTVVAKEAQDINSIEAIDGGKEILDESFSANYPLQIAIAEDNVVNQMVIKKFLKKLGYHDFTVYDNGYEISEACEMESYDVVLMDMEMPVMDGIEATQEILANDTITEKPHIVAMTANAMKEDKQRCLDAGMSDFITKPIQLDLLALSLKKAFEITSSRKAA